MKRALIGLTALSMLACGPGATPDEGDETTGDEDLGEGDDEIITIDLRIVPAHVKALFFLATVCDDGRTFADVKSAKMRVVDWTSGVEICRYVPASKGAPGGLFPRLPCVRVRRGRRLAPLTMVPCWWDPVVADVT